MSKKVDKSVSYKLLAKELKKRGYSVSVTKNDQKQVVVDFKRPGGFRWETLALQLSYPMNSSYVQEYAINKNKGLANEFVKNEGVSVPQTWLISNNAAQHELEDILKVQPRLIVKPTNSTLSRGVTLNIKTLPAFKNAIKKASAISDPVLIQEQVEGDEIRLLVIKGKLKCALLRQTARVVGDGVSSVHELIRQENQARRKLDFEHIFYPQLSEKMVTKRLLISKKILPRGDTLELNKSTMVKGGASIYNITNQTHSGYIEIAEKLAKKLGAGFISVDIFCKDYRVAPNGDNYHFIEFNSCPVLRLCYASRDGKLIDIVPALVDLVDDTLRRRGSFVRPQEPHTIFGCYEKVSFPSLGLKEVIAKIDTGAESGALHCSMVKVIKKNNQKKLKFKLAGSEQKAFEIDKYYLSYVRSSSGQQMKRYLIETEVFIHNQRYKLIIGLSDRTNMHRKVLIGRRFLQEHGILVDVRKNKALDNELGYMKA